MGDAAKGGDNYFRFEPPRSPRPRSSPSGLTRGTARRAASGQYSALRSSPRVTASGSTIHLTAVARSRDASRIKSGMGRFASSTAVQRKYLSAEPHGSVPWSAPGQLPLSSSNGNGDGTQRCSILCALAAAASQVCRRVAIARRSSESRRSLMARYPL